MAVAAERERVTDVQRYRFTVDEFARMGEAGIFTEDDRVELDRLEKIPRYGRAGIPETWLADIEAGAVTVYTELGPNGYERQQVRRRGDELAATSVPELGFPVFGK